MPRSPLQPGPETHHYHDTLGVDEQVPAGATPTLAEVLAAGNDTGGIYPAMQGSDLTISAQPLSGATPGASEGAFLQLDAGGADGGNATLLGGEGDTGKSGGSVALVGGSGDNFMGAGARLSLRGGFSTGQPGGAQFKVLGSEGTAAQVLGSGGNNDLVWQTPLVRIGAGVPSGAPGVAELPIAFDSTAVTGGAYVWNGAAWVQVSVIP